MPLARSREERSLELDFASFCEVNQCLRFRLPTATTFGNVEVLQREFFGGYHFAFVKPQIDSLRHVDLMVVTNGGQCNPFWQWV